MANKTSQCHPSLWLYETNAFCPAWAKPTQAAQTSDPASKQKALLASLFHPVSVQGTGAVGTRMTPRSSLAGRRATLRRKERCTAAVLSSRRVSQVGRAGQEPSRRERDGGGWRRRLGWLPGREDRELAQALAQKLEAEGMVCSPRSCLEPSQLPSLNLPRGGRQESNTPAQHPHGIPPLFPADPTPSRGFPCTETPPPPSPSVVGRCPQGDGSAASPATLRHLRARGAAGPKRLRRLHAFPETESQLIIANVIAAVKEAASRSRQYPA